jgi:nicotinate-nucleotide pyrophosphorylase (carboxylating)
MGEAIWRHLGGDSWRVTSAGTRPAGFVHPLAIAALKDGGIPDDGLHSKSTADVQNQKFDLVVTVCDAASQSCPTFPQPVRCLHWPFLDPAKPLSKDESLADFIAVRDAIYQRIKNFLHAESLMPKPAAPTGGQAKLRFDGRAANTAIWLARRALAEDLHEQVDVTSAAIIPESAVGSADFVSRNKGVVCGLEVCRIIVSEFGQTVQFETRVSDGDDVAPGQPLATLRGPARAILLLERTCLNFLGRLSGVASLTAQYVAQVRGTKAQVFDTRKTTPGWRALEKYAVRCGGGSNHRMGLYDGILIKDNHLALCRQLPANQQAQVDQVIAQARTWLQANRPDAKPPIRIEVEVDSIDQFRRAIGANPDIVLLDNMPLDTMGQCVAIRDQTTPQVLLEASGGINLQTIGDISKTGVDRISVGALTHSAVNFDIGLDWRA